MFVGLVSEGYITEFADGTLLLPPVSHPPKPSPKKSGRNPAESPSGREPESPRNEDAPPSKEEGSEKAPAGEAS